MLAQFDTGDPSPLFRQTMVGVTGGAVCAAIVGMGLYMTVRATRQLRQLRAAPERSGAAEAAGE